jgi:RNA polymerase sigma-70 factor (ECF subfamily)
MPFVTTPLTSDDAMLLQAARQGHAESFGVFFARRHGAVLAYLRPRVRNSELAADLMCETFAAALIAVHDHERQLPERPVSWLLTIAHRELLDALRRGVVADAGRQRLNLERLELEDRDIAAVETAAENARLLEQLAEELPPEQLRAFASRVLEERDYAEIARELSCSEAVIRKRVSRALATLRANRGAM